MKLCVGATSRLMVEEAAKLQVHQIVASRRQVDEYGGYIGMTPIELVEVVNDLSKGKTQVVRDHGGPYQNGDPDDDWDRAFDVDVSAGFDALHVDVCKMDPTEQLGELDRLVRRYSNLGLSIEVGGERDDQVHNEALLRTALRYCVPTYGVVDVGGHAWADRQCGTLSASDWVKHVTTQYHTDGVGTKAHNMDWVGRRHRYDDVLDAYNVAPEFAAVEIDAWLRILPSRNVIELINAGYASRRWERWFDQHEGTGYERARCALRYVWIGLDRKLFEGQEEEDYVRAEVRNALRTG